MSRLRVVSVCLLLAFGCSADPDENVIYADAGPDAVELQDAGPLDAGPLDTGLLDAGLADTGPVAEPDTWTTLANMPTARLWLGAASSNDGRVFVMGGLGSLTLGSPALSTAEVYDPATNEWAVVESMPTARFGAAVVTGADGLIYVIGGLPSYAGGILGLRTVEAYDPASDTWQTRADLPEARRFASAALGADGRIYVIGGNNDASAGLRSVVAYSMEGGWETVAETSVAHFYAAATSDADGKPWVVGGAFFDTAEHYNATTDMWASAPPMLTERVGLGVARSTDGRLFAFGGYDEAYTTLGSAEALTPDAKQWVLVAEMPTARFYLAATASNDGRIYVVGGTAASGGLGLGTLEAYQP